MDLDANVVDGVGCASISWVVTSSPAVQRKHLLDLDPVHRHGVDG